MACRSHMFIISLNEHPMGVSLTATVVCLLSWTVAIPVPDCCAFVAFAPCRSHSKPKHTTPQSLPTVLYETPSRGQFRCHADRVIGRDRRGVQRKSTTFTRRLSQTDVHANANGFNDREEVLNVVVTGANRGLGLAIAEGMVKLGHRTVLACRNTHEGDAALEQIHGRALAAAPARGRADAAAKSATVHQLDVTSTQSILDFRENGVGGQLGGRVDVLFNNAGVCIEGADASVFDSTLAVNFFGALAVMEACLPAMHRGSAVESRGQGLAATASTAVWVSSGDGELCFLGSKWQRILSQASTFEEVKLHIANLQASLDETPEQEEVAFGPTPAYSLSKAAANAAVRTLAPTLQTHTEGGVRLVAVCPGDVLTRMCSVHGDNVNEGKGVEGCDRAAISPEEAARAVIEVALRPFEFPGGRFYRNGKEIGW